MPSAVTPRHDFPSPRMYSSPRLSRPHDPSFAHLHYDNNAHPSLSFSPPPTPPQMYSFTAQSSSWQNQHVHLFPSNPYPTPSPPPPIAHKVWILDCKSCSTFLTNRGMKAVLLLRPNVSLYSSDALPVNCSAYSSNPEVLRAKPSCRPAASHTPHRTCECLTQTLCCHGCGNSIGYMIVIPCTRCTSSISATNRATNGHRFVFHSSEVTGTERHYVADEPGVIPFEPRATALPSSPMVHTMSPSISYPPPYVSPGDPYASREEDFPYEPSRSSSPSPLSDYLPTPPLEFADPIIATSALRSTEPSVLTASSGRISRSPPPFRRAYRTREERHSPSPHSRSSPAPVRMQSPNPEHVLATSAAPPPEANFSTGPSLPSGMPSDYKEPSPPPTLKAGDILFWHHLARSGEIPGVADDEQARKPDVTNATDKKAAAKTIMFNR